jgi:N-carbamoyl-L-amino-acid hydrolase
VSGGIAADDLAARLAGLEGIGETPEGIVRLAWTPEDAACRAWFAAQARALGRTAEADPAGNLWAPPPDAPAPWWGAGSHLDSVRGGGRFDGPLGVAAAFAIAERATVPVAVLCLADEEGARYNTPTFGSRALVGRLDAAEAVARTDDRGIALGDALRAAGVDPDGLARAPEWLARLRGFLELHIDQTRELATAGRAAGAVSGLAARLRLQVDVDGQADHAGTTPPAERRDAMSAAARLIVAAENAAGRGGAIRVTASRILVAPNALTTIAGHVRLWLDARAAGLAAVDGWLDAVRGEAAAIAARTRTEIAIHVASRSAGTPFDPRVRAALGGGDELLSFAGHDAGVLAERIPAGMVFVRNPTGISHAPAEAVDLGDAAAGATAMLRALEELAA